MFAKPTHCRTHATIVALSGSNPDFGTKIKRPQGAFDFCGGVRHFYGHLYTTSGNLQGKFAIFTPKTNFTPRPSRISFTSRKKFPKQITWNLFKKRYIFVDFLTNFWYNTTQVKQAILSPFLFALPDIGGAFLLQKRE